MNSKEKLLHSSQSTNSSNQTKSANESNVTFYLIYLLMIGLTLVSNLEEGVIPSSLSKLKEDFYFEEALLGLIETITVLGKVLGAVIIISSMNNVRNHKGYFILSLLSKIASLLLSAFISSPIAFMCCRFTSGMSQAFFIIYFPVWIDQYFKGFTGQKPFIIALMQFCVSISMMLGFGISTVFFLKWQYVFFIEALGLVILGAFIFLSSESNYVKVNNTGSTEEFISSQSLYELKLPSKASLQKMGREPLFVLLSLSIVSSFFVFSSIKHWSSYYMSHQLELSDRGLRYCAFTLIFFSGPIIGLMFGAITTSLIGGYEHKKAIALCLIYHILGYSFSWVLFLYESTVLFVLALWVLFFFNSASMMMEAGIAITVFPIPCKGDAFTFLTFLNYLIGYLPSPLIYGALDESTKAINSKSAFFFAVQMNVISLIALVVACLIRCFKQSPVFPNSKNRVTEMLGHGLGFVFGQFANFRCESA